MELQPYAVELSAAVDEAFCEHVKAARFPVFYILVPRGGGLVDEEYVVGRQQAFGLLESFKDVVVVQDRAVVHIVGGLVHHVPDFYPASVAFGDIADIAVCGGLDELGVFEVERPCWHEVRYAYRPCEGVPLGGYPVFFAEGEGGVGLHHRRVARVRQVYVSVVRIVPAEFALLGLDPAPYRGDRAVVENALVEIGVFVDLFPGIFYGCPPATEREAYAPKRNSWRSSLIFKSSTGLSKSR